MAKLEKDGYVLDGIATGANSTKLDLATSPIQAKALLASADPFGNFAVAPKNFTLVFSKTSPAEKPGKDDPNKDKPTTPGDHQDQPQTPDKKQPTNNNEQEAESQNVASHPEAEPEANNDQNYEETVRPLANKKQEAEKQSQAKQKEAATRKPKTATADPQVTPVKQLHYTLGQAKSNNDQRATLPKTGAKQSNFAVLGGLVLAMVAAFGLADRKRKN